MNTDTTDTTGALEAAERRIIRDAMDRLLAGTPIRSDGKLTAKSLAVEADVKRWRLTHHHTDLQDEFRDKIQTQAWLIYRRSAGRISLGIQYGHLEPPATAGYGSRVSAGLRGVFPMEEALTRASRLSDAADRLDAGEHVSGPAASPSDAAPTSRTATPDAATSPEPTPTSTE